MDLKGAFMRKIKGKKKAKMKKTLKRMEETRKEDSRLLRDELLERIKKAYEMRKQKLELLKKKRQEANRIEEEILRLNGFIEEGSDILKTRKDDNPKA